MVLSEALRFVVPGEPVGKERARVYRTRNVAGKVVTRGVTPPKTEAYEDKVRMLAQIAVNKSRWSWSKEDRFRVAIRVFRKHRDAGPDLDNIVKAIADSANGILWPDDRYIWNIEAEMRQDKDHPRVEIEVSRIAA